MKKLALVTLIGLLLLALPLRAQINLLHEFADGGCPKGSLIISGSTIYGMTNSGGVSTNLGTIFKIQMDGTGYILLHDFIGSIVDGAWPIGDLILSGSTLYGMTSSGGDSDYGTIFKIGVDGTGFTLLHEFGVSATDGRYPHGSLLISGTTLYGMTSMGGDSDKGTIFNIQTDGADFTLLHEFGVSATDGRYPHGSLLISGSTLYGMTQSGAISWGTIFKIQTNGTGYTLLYEFVGEYADDGSYPNGSLIFSGSTLYGMTEVGGANDMGTIFKIQTDGSGYTKLYDFGGDWDNSAKPLGSLILSGSTLFGMTSKGGAYGYGTIFKIKTSGTEFSRFWEFEGGATDGAVPMGSLILSGSTIYGMTSDGGDSNQGVVFSLPLSITISGTVTCAGSPLANVVMNGLPGNPLAYGFYAATVNYGWSGTVTPALQNFIFTPPSTTYSSIVDNQTTNYTATLTKNLVVTSPSSASIWETGITYTITWLKQATQNANVKILLYKGMETLVQTITLNTANDGAYDWLLPATLAAGNNYSIRVRTVDNLISDDSDKFSILVPAITVTAPTTGIVWVKNATKTITWNKIGTQDANVKIQLYRGVTKTLDISLSTANDGSYDWAIPASLVNASNYTIRITTLDVKVKGISKKFIIAGGLIKVTAPATGTRWQRGVAHTITWTREGTLNANVKILLIRGTATSTIVASTPNDGSYSWTIPANKALANYKIRVTTVDNLVKGESGIFAITR